jgi:aerobic-type carbon monoxide dehydrogenase small subunit (CoxS/CutS family)
MAAQALVERGEQLSREQVVEQLSGHLCRCTGYVKIVDAVHAAVNGRVGSPA